MNLSSKANFFKVFYNTLSVNIHPMAKLILFYIPPFLEYAECDSNTVLPLVCA